MAPGVSDETIQDRQHAKSTAETRPTQEQPEHRSERRRFLIWALMLGAVPPQRVTDRIVREVEDEASS